MRLRARKYQICGLWPRLPSILITYQSQERNAINCDHKQIISQQTKGTTVITTPSVYNTTSNPDWVKNQERWCWNGECHSDSAPNRHNPSKDLKIKTYSITFSIIMNPLYYALENL